MENLFIAMIFVVLLSIVTFVVGIIMLLAKLGTKKTSITIIVSSAIVFVVALIIGLGACVNSMSIGGMH